MNIRAILLPSEMGRRIDDFTSEIVDAAVSIHEMAGNEAAELFMDENLIDFEITQRVLSGLPRQRRSAYGTPLVRFEVESYRRRLPS